MTREELHALIWSEPMRTVARAMDISDVALANRCRRINVPVPPRGWWARKAAGKPVRVAPLPPPPFVFRNYFPALTPVVAPADPQSGPVKPVFRDLVVITKEIEGAVGVVRIPRDLSLSHPIVARLLQQDEARKEEQHGRAWLSSYWGPKFVSEVQQRRLRLLTGLFRKLECLGCKVSGSTHAGEVFGVRVGSRHAYIYCHVTSGAARGRDRSTGPRLEQLVFDITDHDLGRGKPKRSWTEGEAKLGVQAREIVSGILLHVEGEARAGALDHHRFMLEEIERRRIAARLAAEKTEADRIAQQQAVREARVRALLDGMEAFETAARIRRYVSAVKERYAMSSPADIARWADWALDCADDVDPLVSGKFISGLDDQ